jgi:MOSC domain-containing protein YiiM
MTNEVLAGRVYQINVSNGGVPKWPVPSAWVTCLGIEGDRHRSPSHGGPERALCLFSLEVIRLLQAEGHPIMPGAAGENLTLEGLDFAALHPGDRLRIGDAVLIELTRHTTPCVNIAGCFKDGDFTRILQTKFPGHSRMYARVLQEGEIVTGDPVYLVSRTAQTEG